MITSYRIASVAVLGALLAAACDHTPTGSESAVRRQSSSAPLEVPLFEQFQAENCGEVVTFTMDGTARIQQRGDMYVLVARGTVTTSNGFTGTFNRQFVIKGDQLAVLRFHDMEVNSATGQRVIFAMGMYLYAYADGIHIVNAEKYGGGACVGF